MRHIFFYLFFLVLLKQNCQSQQVCINALDLSITNTINITGSSSATADFNNDGKPDIVTLDKALAQISILINAGLGSFQTPITYTTAAGPYDIVTSDFNQDGNVDLGIASHDANSVSVLIGLGDGTFLQEVNYSVVGQPYSITTGDYNGDGNTDICVGNIQGSVSVLLGTLNGTFSSATNYPVNFWENSITSGDFNNDGNSDIAISAYQFNAISVLYGSSAGTLSAAVNYSTNTHPLSLVNIDFDEDGNADLVSLNTTSIEIFFGTGMGSFNASVTYSNTMRATIACVKDLNNDGKKDLIFTGNDGTAIVFGSGTGVLATQLYYTFVLIPNTIADFTSDGNMDLLCWVETNRVKLMPGKGDGSYNDAQIFPAVNAVGLIDIVAADFNGDGNEDIAGCSASLHNVTVFMNSGSKTISSSDTYTVGLSPQSITTGDFNKDGSPDLATANLNSNNISVLLNTSNGSFGAAVNYSTNSSATFGIISDDFNNDGNPDIATANVSDLSIFLGLGNGSFSSATTLGAGYSPRALISSDFNKDGNADIVFTDGSSNQVIILLGSGTGSFSVMANYNVGQYPINIITNDFNLDGVLDIATANNLSNDISVLFGLGNGTFSSAVNYPTSPNLRGLASKDINGDNKPDILVVCTHMEVLLNSGNGSFTHSGSYEVGVSPYEIIMPDFDNNGNADIIVASFSTSSINVVLNNGISVSAPPEMCAGNSATIAAVGATSYSWSTGDNTSNIVVTPISTTDYTVTGITSGMCTSSVVKTINVVQNPTVTAVSTDSLICAGSTVTLTAIGADSYTWSTGSSSTSIAITPTITTQYNVSGYNICGLSTQTISVTVDNTCQDVWPGDANSDGVADNTDILELGLHYTQTGPPRATVSNNWQSYYSSNWAGTITNGKNVNHSDCNGDGIIGDDDTLAIYNNYGLTHTFRTSQISTPNPALSIVPDQGFVTKGSWGTASVYLGDAATTINNINGVAFTVDFDNTLIEPNSIYLEYQNSFIDAGQNLKFRKLNFANGELYTATTHTVSNDVSGFGKIATLHYQVKSSLTTDETLNLGITQASMSDASGIITPLSSGTGTLMAIGASVGLTNNQNTLVSIVPNPASDYITIRSTYDIEKVEITNVAGQVLKAEQIKAQTTTINIQDLANGVYFVKVYQVNGVNYMIKKLVVSR